MVRRLTNPANGGNNHPNEKQALFKEIKEALK
jgi:hypothetical protein